MAELSSSISHQVDDAGGGQPDRDEDGDQLGQPAPTSVLASVSGDFAELERDPRSDQQS